MLNKLKQKLLLLATIGFITVIGYLNFNLNAADIHYSNTNSLPSQTNALNNITTGNDVTIKNTDNVNFEAGGSVSIGSILQFNREQDFK